jgi:hypothetical protein
MTARVDVLTDGYAGDRVASTVTLICDGEDLDLLQANRDKVLTQRPALIIPGHGAPFAPR